eukprot:132625-Chlamydomonas_euryale.AAC.1
MEHSPPIMPAMEHSPPIMPSARYLPAGHAKASKQVPRSHVGHCRPPFPLSVPLLPAGASARRRGTTTPPTRTSPFYSL